MILSAPGRAGMKAFPCFRGDSRVREAWKHHRGVDAAQQSLPRNVCISRRAYRIHPLPASLPRTSGVDEAYSQPRFETHYKAIGASDALPPVPGAPPQAVYAALGGLMGEIHALALHTCTPVEWAQQGAAPDSPTCMGGSKHDTV